MSRTSVPPELVGVYREAVAAVGNPAFFDAHTHIGQNDPDGRTATAEEILAGLDEAGHARAMVFAMHEPRGYRAANDAVLAAAATSGGRLLPLARIAPNDPGALVEARRCLEAGARGFKLHPRSDAFALPHPVVDEVVGLAAEHRMPVLFHAGRGIPRLGEAVTALAERHPDVRIILAHAAVSDLGLVAPAAERLTNLYFDTAWGYPSDVLQLFATVPPGRILYASDMPYGAGVLAALAMLRCAAAVGLDPATVGEIAGGQLARVIDGEEPADLGPAPGVAALGPRVLEGERAATYAMAAMQLVFRGADPTEALALGRCACQTTRTDATGRLLGVVDGLLARTEALAREGGADPFVVFGPCVAAAFLAATPALGVPDALLAS